MNNKQTDDNTQDPTCTCPSGDGSLRWPCPAHPPESASGSDGTAAANAAGLAFVNDGSEPDWDAYAAAERNVYEYGPEGMPRVERMPHTVLDCIIDHSLFRYFAASLEGEDRDRLYGLMHDTANEVLARLPRWPAERAAATSVAALEVLAERHRQALAEGWTPDHDDGYTDGALARAAAAYTLNTVTEDGPHYWPWPRAWWKPTDARRDLVKAGALLLAEIERIDRAAAKGTAGQASIGKSLVRPAISATNPLPLGCHCKPGQCMAPRIMGSQTPCRDPEKRDRAAAPAPAAESVRDAKDAG